jgi:hypothetical protein
MEKPSPRAVTLNRIWQPGRKSACYARLQEFDIGVILNAEQIDVRHVLLADSPFAPALGARTPLQTEFNFFLFLY